MRFLLKVSMVLSFFLFIVSCYESEVAMAPVKEAVFDAKLIGRWKAVGLEYDEAAKLVILNFNDREYFIQHNLWEKRDWSVRSEVYLCRAYTIMMDGAAFCNVQYISSAEKEKRSFMFFRYSFSKDGILTWRWVSNDLIKKKIRSSKDLYAFIKKNKNNEKLYGKPLKFKNDIQKQ